MGTSGEQDLLLKLIEFVGLELEENYRPEDIRMSSEKVQILLDVANSGVALEGCPNFLNVFRAVMLRDAKELGNNGTLDEG